MIRIPLLAAMALCAFPAPGAECARCHAAEAGLHAASAHAAALSRPAGSLFATQLSGRALSEAAGGYSFTYQLPSEPGRTALDVTVQRGADRLTAPLVWIFGSGRQGQTPVVYWGGRFIEHRVSYYVTTGYGITIGQENGASADARHALGRAESNADAKLCFECHATGVSRDLARMTPGVQCVRCHAGAEEHAAAEEDGRRGQVVNPGKLAHKAQVELCGECHRVKPPSGDENSIGNVRFQPLRLMKSACFRKGGIECTTCHAAHRNAERDAAKLYNGRCAGCHTDGAAHAAKVGGDNCVGCHMPKVSPAPGLVFTDHYIRVTGA